MNPAQSIRGVLFDLDGTLLDTLSDIANAANAVLAQQGFPPHPVDTYRHLAGDGVRVLFQRALPEGNRSDATLTACLAAMKSEYARHLNRTARAYPGMAELLQALRAMPLRLGVLSNKDHEFTVSCVESFFGRGLFDTVMGLRVGSQPKPHPGSALEIAAQWNLPPQDIAYLGDTDTDMKTAVAAGMQPIGVRWGFRTEAELLRHGAACVIGHPLDLLGLTGR